jgi:hypothetical protein
MQLNAKSRTGFIYILSIGLGALIAQTTSPRLLLPVFLIGIACVVVLTLLAHKYDMPPQWGESKRLTFAVFALLLGPTGTETKSGAAPRLLLMALLFMLGFIFALALHFAA